MFDLVGFFFNQPSGTGITYVLHFTLEETHFPSEKKEPSQEILLK